jgi:hypothetical protein
LHHYHHENNNWFAYLSQILLEINFAVIFVILYKLFNTCILDEWVILYFVLFYSSIHNINYSIFHVNKIHSLHHKKIMTNIGPDICDIIFNTKNKKNKKVENTNHYIPNIMIITCIICALQYLFINKNIQNTCIKILNKFFLFTTIFLISCSLYLQNIK